MDGLERVGDLGDVHPQAFLLDQVGAEAAVVGRIAGEVVFGQRLGQGEVVLRDN